MSSEGIEEENPAFRYFPHDSPRPMQEDLIKDIYSAVSQKNHIIAHAPTGLGKTAASLAPVIQCAINNDLRVMFLTSRQTQHQIAIDTLRTIVDKHDIALATVDIIGKKSMCIHDKALESKPGEFHEYCKRLREEKQCKFFNNLKSKNKLAAKAKETIKSIHMMGPLSTGKVTDIAREANLCPYYLQILRIKKARIVVGDYYYAFHPNIRDSFMKAAGLELEKTIIIVDEGHNLPFRIKDLATKNCSLGLIRRAMTEAKKYDLEDAYELLEIFQNSVVEVKGLLKREYEQYIDKKIILTKLAEKMPIDEVIINLAHAGELVLEVQRTTSIGAVANFLDAWRGSDKGYTRIAIKDNKSGKETVNITFRCLDPGLLTAEIIGQSWSTILMSGTLTPTSMYKDLLGFPQSTKEVTFASPFPKKNRLNIIVPKTSTKFNQRTEQQFKDIASELTDITNSVPGNCIIFFPSYDILNKVNEHFQYSAKKTVMCEYQGMHKEEKQDLLDQFKSYSSTGAVLLGVAAGNFAEGVDLPGDLLKCVVVVGLPLQRPDLETKALINYIDEKYRRGWEYGYVAPAFNKTLQSAGRCIRSENDKGVIVFLDERYAWGNYISNFPTDLDIKVDQDPKKLIEEFFKK